jgi:hypothetical protein
VRAGDERPGRSLAASACALLFAEEVRPRSGLAYAAGFAGVAYLFQPSAAALASGWLGPEGLWLAYLWGASAPVAMAFGLAAASDLDRAGGAKAGRPQALSGYLIGLWGTLVLISEAQAWWHALRF